MLYKSNNSMNSVKSSNVINRSSVASSNSINSNSVSSSSVSSHNVAPSKPNVSPAKPKQSPAANKKLADRTTVHDVNNNVRHLQITEKTGDVIAVDLKKPSVPVAEDIGDSRWVMGNGGNRHVTMRATTPKYQRKLFQIFHNLEVNGVPTRMNFSFADKHYEAFMWLMRQGDLFLGDKFNAAE